MPIKVNTYNQKGETVSTIELSKTIFGLDVNEALLHQAMVAQMSNERQVLAHTKDRSEVRGGGKKPWRQKGTGRARVGSSRSPIWIGGGVTFGPTKDRNFKKDINKKMKQKAMLMVLSDKVRNGCFAVLENLELNDYKTKEVDAMVKKLETSAFKEKEAKTTDDKKKKPAKNSALIIIDKKDEKVKYSSRNLAGVKQINFENINILDLLKYRNLLITKESVLKIEEQYRKV
jgi:large subunit ribosomal protein L4